MVAVYARLQRSRAAVVAFAGGYLALWTGAGVAAYALAVSARGTSIGALSWQHGGRFAAAGVLAAAAIYQLTPWKSAASAPAAHRSASWWTQWRDGAAGAVAEWAQCTARGGLGCCWALMASLFALGIMSVTWMALFALLIAGEKLLPWRDGASRAVAALLVAFAVAIALDPASVPGLTLPTGM